MNTQEINKILKNVMNHCFVGTFLCDQLPRIDERPAAVIINTDTSTKLGEHWVAAFIFRDGSGEYFDPYGFSPLQKEILDFMNLNTPLGWGINTNTIQSLDSTNCGRFCIIYVALRCKGKSSCQIIHMFSENLNKNDKIVNNFFKK